MLPDDIWNFIHHQLEPRLRRAQRGLAAAIIVVASFSGATVVGTAVNYDDVAEVTAINQQQDRQIHALESEITQLKVAIATVSKPDMEGGKSKVRQGFCTCLRKDNAKTQEFVDCPAKNFVCDKESRDICESQHAPAYEC